MKSLIICKSIHHKNTNKIAEAMAEVLYCEIKQPEEVNIKTLYIYNLIGFGSGIYFQNYHKSIFDCVDNLPIMKGKKAFIFATSGLLNLPAVNNFQTPLKNKLQEKGFEVVGIFSCRGWDTFGLLKYFGGINKGKPNENDIQKAKDFARRLML
jgi:flavodoxin